MRDFYTTITIDEFEQMMNEKFEKEEKMKKKMTIDMKIVDDLVNKIRYFHVKCPNVEIFDAITKIGKRYGWIFEEPNNVYTKYITQHNGMYVVVHINTMHHNNLQDSQCAQEIPIELFEEYLKTIKERKENNIMIGKYDVKFKKDGSIQVGCHTVDFDTISKIYGKCYLLSY